MTGARSNALPTTRTLRGAPGAARGRVRTEDGVDAARGRTPARQKATALTRERHQADWAILVIVVALTAIGVLMVYSSSAMKAYLASDDTFKVVGPQNAWAGLGIVALFGMMKLDYRYLRFISVPLFAIAVGTLVLLLVLPTTGPVRAVSVGGSARWLQVGPLPAVHPAEIAKLAMIVYLAHWFAKRGSRVKGFWAGTVPFLIIVAPVVALVFKEPDLGTTMVIGLTALTLFFVAGGRMVHLAGLGFGSLIAIVLVGLHGYQM